MREPIIILILIFVLVGLFYSPAKKAETNRQSSSSIGASNGSLPYSPNKNISETLKDTERNIEELSEDIEEAEEASRRSPYYGKIRLSGVSGLYNSDPSHEYISLYAYLEENETVKITGWRLQSDLTGYYATIGRASLLPFPFTRTESDVVLQYGDRAYLVKGFSPIGISFRTNKCTGFFEENRDFTPSLPRQCPRPINESLPRFSTVLDREEECLKLIERVPRCTTRGYEYVRDLPDTVTSSCKTYLTTQINYNTCVARHFGDTDFPGDEYYLYFNKFGPLWRLKSDKIRLYDQNNLIVDTIEY